MTKIITQASVSLDGYIAGPDNTGFDEWVNTDTPFVFVTDGVESAIKQAVAAADGKDVGIGPGSTVDQAIDLGLVDEIRLDLVPHLLGGGTRMLTTITSAPLSFTDPEVIPGIGVTHLSYRRRVG